MSEPALALADPADTSARVLLKELRRARRGQRIRDFDIAEAFYRSYVAAVVTGVAIWLLGGVVGDSALDPAGVHRVSQHGAAVVGLVVAVAWAIGLRSGGRGGPLAIEAADVRHVLLSPVDRGVALRATAVRQLRFVMAAGAAVGAIAGLLAWHRLPGNPVAWIASGAGVGLVTAAGAFGLALIASGRRLGPLLSGLLALLVVAWSVVDVVTGRTTSPAGQLGRVGILPLHFSPLLVIGPVLAAGFVAAGLRSVGGSSLEAAERRSALVGNIRFAATMRDLRTVMVLRRQLAQELPRSRPWIALSRTERGLPAWRRSWHGIFRFPLVRVVRLAILGLAAGAAMVGVWNGTTPLVLVGGLCLYVAALDAVEPVGQAMDHPDLGESYTMENGDLLLRLSSAPALVMLAVTLFAWLGAVVVSGFSSTAIQVGAVMLIPAALCATGAGVMSTVLGGDMAFHSSDVMLPPEFAGMRTVLRSLIPPLIAVCGVLPVLGGPHASGTPLQGVLATVPLVVLLGGLSLLWVRYWDRVKAWWSNALKESQEMRKPGQPMYREPKPVRGASQPERGAAKPASGASQPVRGAAKPAGNPGKPGNSRKPAGS